MSQACNFNLWAPIHSPSLSVTLIICLHFLSNIPERTIGHYTSWENSFCFLKDRLKLNNDVDKHTCPSVAYTTDLQNCWQIWEMCVLSNKSRFHSLCILMYVLGFIVLICFSYVAVPASTHTSNSIRIVHITCLVLAQIIHHLQKVRWLNTYTSQQQWCFKLLLLSSAHHMQHKCSDNIISRAGQYISYFKIYSQTNFWH